MAMHRQPTWSIFHPVTCIFKPKDGELIFHYLRKRLAKEELPLNKIIEVNLYQYNPETLVEKYEPQGEREWYFFTPRDRKYKNCNRVKRASGDGFWKPTSHEEAITYNGEHVGNKRRLVFYKGKPPMGARTAWIMLEFTALTPPRVRSNENDMRLDDCVLCKIYNNHKSGSLHGQQRDDGSAIQQPDTNANGEFHANYENNDYPPVMGNIGSNYENSMQMDLMEDALSSQLPITQYPFLGFNERGNQEGYWAAQDNLSIQPDFSVDEYPVENLPTPLDFA